MNFCWKKSKGPSDKPPQKRRKIDLMAKVITHETLLQEITENEERKKGKNTKARKNIKQIPDEDFPVPFADGDDGDNEENEDEGEECSEGENFLKPTEPTLQSVWEKLNPPNTEEAIINRWYAVIYQNKKRTLLYVGKALRRFLSDKDGHATLIEVECLKSKCGTGTEFESTPSHLPKDIETFPIYNVIAGPLVATMLKGNRWDIPEYGYVKKTFDIVGKVDRKTEWEKLYK